MTSSKVAVITRTKNRTILLRRAVEGVLAQTFPNWEMIIVNDGGDPEPVDSLVAGYAERAAGRIRVIHNSVSLGMEAASNVGLRAGDSAYVIIHDDDDSWHPEFLARSVAALESAPVSSIAGVVTHSVRILETIEGDRVVTQSQEPFNNWLKTVTLHRMAASNVFPPISFLYKRSVFDAIGFYREDLPVLGDWEFNLRFMTRHDILVLPEELAYYHHRLDIRGGDYSNSVIGGHDKHALYDALLRNELLRRDLEAGTMGLGHLVNFSLDLGPLRHLQEQSLDQVGGLRAHLSAFDTHVNNRLDAQDAQLARKTRLQKVLSRLSPRTP